MRNKKGFTLVEIVVTLAILGISFGLTIGVVSALTSIQGSSSKDQSINDQLLLADKTIGNYVNFISVKTDNISFSYDDEKTSNSDLVFCYVSPSTSTTFDFHLKFNNHALSIESNYDESISYLTKTENADLSNIDNITFEYHDENTATKVKGLLVAEITSASTSTKYTYVLRTEQ